MRRTAFTIGLLAGAALGVAGMLLARRFEGDAPASGAGNIASAGDPRSPAPGAHPREARGRPTKSAATSLHPALPVSEGGGGASSEEAPRPQAGTLDALIEEASNHPPDMARPICETIARKFPDFRFPVDFVHRLADSNRFGGQQQGCERLVEFGVATWSDGFALDEFRRTLRTQDRAETLTAGAIARVLAARGVRLPADLCGALLHDDDPSLRARGERLSQYSAEVDLARITALAGHDPDPSVRSTAFRAMSTLVEGGRVQGEQVAEAIADGVRDADDEVESAARAALVAAGPAGAKLALDLLARDGDAEDAKELAAAVVAGGMASDLLDLHLGRSIDGFTALAMAELAASRVDVLDQLTRRFADLVASVDAGDDATRAAFFSALVRAGQTRLVSDSVVAHALAIDTRTAALDALLGRESTWRQGHELARKIAADRGEPTRMRTWAIDQLDFVPDGAPDGEFPVEEPQAFLRELLRTETNDRVRKYVGRILGAK